MATGGDSDPLDKEEITCDSRYTSVDEDIGNDDLGRTNSVIQEELMKGGIERCLHTDGNGGWFKKTFNNLCFPSSTQRYDTKSSSKITDNKTKEGFSNSESDSEDKRTGIHQKKQDGGHQETNDEPKTQISVQAESSSLKRDENSSKKSKSESNSSTSSILPDVVCTSTSTTSDYSVVEDISNHHESSLRCESLIDLEDKHEDEVEVFDNLTCDGSDQYEGDNYKAVMNTLLQTTGLTEVYIEKTKPKTSRQFSTPDNLSEEKLASLKSAGGQGVYKRLISVPVKLSDSLEEKENFGYIKRAQTCKSLSDLGSSLKSSQDDKEYTAQEKRLSYRSSVGYHTGDSKEAESFEEGSSECGSHFSLTSEEFSTKPYKVDNNPGSAAKFDRSSLGQVLYTTTNSETKESSRNTDSLESEASTNGYDRDSSFEIDVNVVQVHLEDETKELFPHGITMLNIRPISGERWVDDQGHLKIDRVKTTALNLKENGHCINNGHTMSSHQPNTVAEADLKENPHDKFARELLEQWDRPKKAPVSAPSTADMLYKELSHEYKEACKRFEGTHSNRRLQDILKNGNYSLDSLEELIANELYSSDLDTDCPSINDKQEETSVGEETMDEEEQGLLLQLQRAKQCDDKLCENEQCKLGKVLLSSIKNSNASMVLDRYVRVAFVAIAKHSSVCSEGYCMVPWCNVFSDCHCTVPESSDVQDIETNLVEDVVRLFVREHLDRYGEGKKTLRLTPEEVEHFISIDEGYASLPESGLDIEIIPQLESSENILLAHNMHQRLKIMAIKRARCSEVTMDILSALRDARSFHHSHLVTHLWATKLTYPRNIFIASHFDGNNGRSMNLRKLILSRRQSKVDRVGTLPRDVHKWLVMARDALAFLHSYKILYLNWRAEHLIVSVNSSDPTRYCLKLCSFNSSITKENIAKNHDLPEDLGTKLAPHLVPPEFWAESEVAVVKFPQSDYWPFGCLIYELVTGDPLHWDLRHELVDEQRRKIKQRISNSLSFPEVNNGVKQLLQQCFEKDPEKRWPDFSVLNNGL